MSILSTFSSQLEERGTQNLSSQVFHLNRFLRSITLRGEKMETLDDWSESRTLPSGEKVETLEPNRATCSSGARSGDVGRLERI